MGVVMVASREAMLNSLRALRCAGCCERAGARRHVAACTCLYSVCVCVCVVTCVAARARARRPLASLSDAQRDDAARLVMRLRAAGVDV
jgi:hypothetical protein